MLRRRTIAGPCTGYFQTPVCTVLPCQDTSFGMPTFTEAAGSGDRRHCAGPVAAHAGRNFVGGEVTVEAVRDHGLAGLSRSRVPSRCTSTLSGSKETSPEMRRTSGQASSYDHAARRASPTS